MPLPDTTLVPAFCPGCGTTTPVKVPTLGFLRWQSGASVTESFPDLSADDRERLISGLCPRCFAEWTKDPDDDPRKE